MLKSHDLLKFCMLKSNTVQKLNYNDINHHHSKNDIYIVLPITIMKINIKTSKRFILFHGKMNANSNIQLIL